MPRRTRRDSDSSVETVDLSRVRWRAESSVLRSLSAETPSNPWPTFELRDAIVLNKDGSALENALNVLLEGPFIVRGTMVIDEDDQREHLVTRVKNEIPIEINPFTFYSIGESDGETEGKPEDAPPSLQVLWVGGQGGWFEVNPAPEYQPIYRKIREAIKLYYTIKDIYDTFGAQTLNRQSKTSDPIERLSPLFLQYSIMVGDGSTVEEVASRCNELAQFLLCQFLRTDDDYNTWKKTYLYRWLSTTHKDTFEKTRKALRSPHRNQAPASTEISSTTNEVPSGSQKESSANSDSSGHASRNSTQALRSTRTRSGSSAIAIEDTSTPEELGQTSLPIHQRYTRSRSKSNNLVPEIIQKGRSPESTRTAGKMQSSPSLSTDDQTAFDSLLEVLEEAFEELSQKKLPSKTQILNKIYFGNKFPNYRVGPGAHRVPVEEVFHFNATRLLQVLDKGKYSGSEIYEWIKQLAGTEFKPVALGLDKFPFLIIPRKSKPFQPRATPNQTAGTAARLIEEDLEASDDLPETPRIGKSTPHRRAGKSSLRPVTSTKKRHHSDIESDSESPSARDAKKSHYFSDHDENMEESDDAESLLASDDPIRLVIRADKIPSTVSRGPDSAWTCDHEDCGYMVRGGDEEDCKARINQHFHEHEQQHDRVQLAMTEGTRGHLPVKYVFFPPFLIVVEFHTSPAPQNASSEVNKTAATPQTTHSPYSLSSGRFRHSPGRKGIFEDMSYDQIASSRVSTSASASIQNTYPTTQSFRHLLHQFRRPPHPISDNINQLIMFQPSVRKTEEARGHIRPGRTPHCRRIPSPPANKEESDSLTEPDESSLGRQGEGRWNSGKIP